MHRNRKLVFLLIPVMLLTQAYACNQSAYHSAVVAEHDFVSALQAFQQAELAEHTNGRIDANEHHNIEAGIEQVAKAAQVLNDGLRAGANNTTIQQDFTSISQSLDALMVTGVFGVKNPQSQNLLAALTKSIQAILQNIGSILSLQTTTPITSVQGAK